MKQRLARQPKTNHLKADPDISVPSIFKTCIVCNKPITEDDCVHEVASRRLDTWSGLDTSEASINHELIASNTYRCPECAGTIPDYSQTCACGTTPVIPLTGMCGVCTFGEASCIDPEEW